MVPIILYEEDDLRFSTRIDNFARIVLLILWNNEKFTEEVLNVQNERNNFSKNITKSFCCIANTLPRVVQ